jgi:hypothetical protein
MNRLRLLILASLWLLCLVNPEAARAQEHASPDARRESPLDTLDLHVADLVLSAASEPRVTLSSWAEDRRLQMLERRQAHGDVTYDRGVFRHITPPMDREYALDMTNYRFSPLEDYAWKHMQTGMRVSTGSIVRAEWALRTELKHTADIGDGHALGIDALMQQDGQAQRMLVQVEYDWNVAAHHHVGVRHSFSNYKPDFDPSFFYQYGNIRQGRIRTEVTLLDAYNNLIFGSLGVSNKDEDLTRIYNRIPVLGQVTLESPDRYPLRGEVYVGWQPESELALEAQDDPTYRYRDQETAHYAGALLEYAFGATAFGITTVGLIAQRDFAALDRQGLREAVTSDYATEQRFQRAGAFVLGAWRSLRAEAWFFLEDYYDRQSGEDFSLSTIGQAMNYTEYRKNYRVRVAYVPSQTGWYTGLEYLGMSRRLPEQWYIMGNEWTNHWYGLAPSNYRVSGTAGYRFGAGAIGFGINFDLDGDEHYKAGPEYTKKRFDNAFFRFALEW